MLLVRDAEPTGVEVFVMRRTAKAVFAADMYVYPGGRVDDVDHAAELEPYCEGLDDAAASARLGIEKGGLAFWVAAVRECFEEAGVLLARRRDGGPLELDEADRKAVHAGELSMEELCRRDDLVLDLGGDPLHRPLGDAGRARARAASTPASSSSPRPLTRRARTTTPSWSHSMWVRPADAVPQAEARRAADDAADDRHPALRVRVRRRRRRASPSPTPSAPRR